MYSPTSSIVLPDKDGYQLINVCFCQPFGMLAQMLQLNNKKDRFCSLESPRLHLVNDNLSLSVLFTKPCGLDVYISQQF
jgi:hypothetical protein